MKNKIYNSSKLAKQVAERIGMNQANALELYHGLSQVPNNKVKLALDILSSPYMDIASYYPVLHKNIMNDVKKEHWSHKYVACIKETEDREIFLEIVEAETPVRAAQIAADHAKVDTDVVILHKV